MTVAFCGGGLITVAFWAILQKSAYFVSIFFTIYHHHYHLDMKVCIMCVRG